MIEDISIGKRIIGRQHRPFIIAEMSGNHNQSLERALQIVEEAAKAGVDAVKLQTYTADTMTLDIHDGDFCIDDPNSLWEGSSYYSLYQQAYTPWEWHRPIFDRCKELGLIAFSSPFDHSAVDFLETLNVPAYKIASFENTDHRLIQKIAATGKPIIMSTGMATAAELDESVRVVKEAGCNNLILLKCTSTYPASPENTNLNTIPHMEELFQCQIGLSDHTMGVGVSVASIVLGATVIEKHFTLSRADGGVDSAFSMEPEEMKQLVIEAERAWQGMGTVKYGPTDAEKASLKHRRSLYIAKDLQEGEVITESHLKAIRPGFGLPTQYADVFIGRKVKQDVRRGTPLSWDLV